MIKQKTDVLVIGSGGAGLRAAIEAADHEADVIVVGKTLLGKAHTVMAEGGINAALSNIDTEDNWKAHFHDTMREGQLINNWKMVEIMAKHATLVIKELESYGALFDRTTDGKIMQRAFGGHSYKRTCHIADRTGLEIMQVLMSQVMKRASKIKTIDEVIITKLVKSKNTSNNANNNDIIGAIGVSLQHGDIVVFECKAIVLATGGLVRLYKRSSNAWETVGDGYFLALDAGAELQDIEMIQFHPTGMVYPQTAEGILVTESVRGEGGFLLNAEKQRFMKKYDAERMELSTRDIVARAVFNEIKQGRGTKHNGVYLDISHMPKEFIEKKLPKMIMKFKELADVDITKEPMEVAPTAHYAMGGVRVDAETCKTAVKGMFAAGEITSGVHGANRLGGNSLADILVFGKIAGRNAALYAQSKKYHNISEKIIEQEIQRLFRVFDRKQGIRPIEIKKKIQKLMWQEVGIIRDEKGLQRALNKLMRIKKQIRDIVVRGSHVYNHEWLQFIDVGVMIPVCESIIRSALLRTESRGAHFRSDYPKKDDRKWLQNIIVCLKKNKIVLTTKPTERIPDYLNEDGE